MIYSREFDSTDSIVVQCARAYAHAATAACSSGAFGSQFMRIRLTGGADGRPLRRERNDISVISQFPGASFTDTRSAFLAEPRWYSPTGIEHPGRSGRFALQRIVHVGPGWTLHTDYPGVIAGTKGLHANRTTGKVVATLRGPRAEGSGGGAAAGKVRAVLMLSILVLSIMRTGSAG